MNQGQEDAIYAAYLGLCTLKRCADKWGQERDVEHAAKLLKEMGETFPFIGQRVASSALRASMVTSQQENTP